MNLKNKTKPQGSKKRQKKTVFLYALFEGRERVLDPFESKIFPIKTKGAGSLDSKRSILKY